VGWSGVEPREKKHSTPLCTRMRQNDERRIELLMLLFHSPVKRENDVVLDELEQGHLELSKERSAPSSQTQLLECHALLLLPPLFFSRGRVACSAAAAAAAAAGPSAFSQIKEPSLVPSCLESFGPGFDESFEPGLVEQLQV